MLKRYISFGAGVQSSTMVLMADKGLFDVMPDGAIFADTQAEPQSVYAWLAWVEKEVKNFPIYRVSRGDLAAASLKVREHQKIEGRRWAQRLIPAFIKNEDGSKGLLGRACTAEYKVREILKKSRALAKVPRGCKTPMVENWIGISTDEFLRMKPSRESWAVNRWPLIEADMSRLDCLRWMEENGYPTPPRSACVFCPFHTDAEWIRLRDEEPEEFAVAVQFDKDLREIQKRTHNLRGVPFLHKSLLPLDMAPFRHDGQRGLWDSWVSECEGMCGV